MPGALRLATRGSPLALAQVRLVEEALLRAGCDRPVETVVVSTMGDRRRDVPIHAVGGQGIFVKEVEQAVLDGAADAAVHSAKDLPSGDGPLRIAAVPPRGDARDALVGRSLADLDSGARVATGSVRRRSQLAWLRPDLTFSELRGNIATRLEKVPDGGAVVVAAVALERLGLGDRAAQVLEPVEMLPQVGQGAIALCCRPDDHETADALAVVDDLRTSVAVRAERAYLAGIGGGCELPVGAHATVVGARSAGVAGAVSLEGLIASPDGHVLVRRRLDGSADGTGPEDLGAELAAQLLGDAGGRALLERSGWAP